MLTKDRTIITAANHGPIVGAKLQTQNSREFDASTQRNGCRNQTTNVEVPSVPASIIERGDNGYDR